MSAARKGELGAKLARWAFYTLLISLVPIILDYAVLVARENRDHSFYEVLEHGELYLLSAAFLCVGLGEIIGTSEKSKIIKIIVGGLNVLVLVSAIGLYVASKNITPYAGGFFAAPSIWFFLASCFVSTSCIAISGLDNV